MKLSAALLVLSLAAPLGVLDGLQIHVSAQQLTRTDLSAADAIATAERLLKALETREAAVVYGQLAGDVRSNTTISDIQDRLNAQRFKGGRVTGTTAGYATTTVDAVITTDQGEEHLLIVLDNDGELLAWKWSDRIIPIQTTALEFAEDLAQGRWLAARSKFSLQFQEELKPGDLERKWTKLAKTSGGFRAIKDAVVAGEGGEQQLVLVSVAFAEITTNLFVIFDESGRIINVDISRDFV